MQAVKSLKIYSDGLLLSKAYKDLNGKEQKSYVSWHWRVMQSLKRNWFLIPKMTWGIWWIFMSAGRSENLPFDMLLLSIAYKVKFQLKKKNDLSWHWRTIQTLKKNWLFVWRMTWRIWWILTQAVESLKIYSLIGYFCRKYVMFELNKQKSHTCEESRAYLKNFFLAFIDELENLKKKFCLNNC